MPYADWFNEPLVTALMASLPTPSVAAEAETGNLSVLPANQTSLEAAEDLSQADILRKRLSLLLQEANNKAHADGMTAEDIEAADFAVCAFIDEALLSSTWRGREEWMTFPLQLERHSTGTAGEDFFRVLDLLLEQTESVISLNDNEVEKNPRKTSLAATLEIFALCLTHGFTGMYFHDQQALRLQLKRIADVVPNVARGLAPLAQQPGFSAETRRPAPRNRLNIMRRIDVLDCLLWLVPPLVVGLLYHVCGMRLNEFLSALQGGV